MPSRMDRDAAWHAFEEARELFYAASLAYRATAQPVNAGPLLKRSVLLLLRSLALRAGVSSTERNDILTAADELERREQLLEMPLVQWLAFFEELDRRAAGVDASATADETAKLERFFERMPKTFAIVRRHLRQGGLSAAARRRRRAITRASVIVGALIVLGAGALVVHKLGRRAYEDVAYDGLRGAYYADASFGQLNHERRDVAIDFDWGMDAPVRGMSTDQFSVRWNGKLRVPETGKYVFYLKSDDGSRLYLNGKLVVDNWGDHGPLEQSASIELAAGVVPLRLDYFENVGMALVQLSWSSEKLPKTVVSGKYLTR